MVSLKIPIIILSTLIGILFIFSYINNNNDIQLNQAYQQYNNNNNNQQQQRHLNSYNEKLSLQSPAFLNISVVDKHNDQNFEDGNIQKIKVPLNLLNIFPTDGSLRNIDPITVVFNRPVVPLGEISTYFPFKLQCKGNLVPIEGDYRWVTTSIARFDIRGKWPSNLQCTFSVDPNIKCFDGTTLTAPLSSSSPPMFISFSTSKPSITIDSVVSEKTSNFTNNQWSSFYTFNDTGYYEVPPDGIIKFSVDEPFDTSSIQKSLIIYLSSSQNLKNKNLITYSIVKCPNEDDYYLSTNYYFCIKASRLETSKFYKAEFKRGTRLNLKSGPLGESIYSEFSGLREFKFYFHNKELSNVNQKLSILHGLPKTFSNGQLLTSMISFTPQLSFTSKLDIKDSSILLLISNLEYGVNYTIRVKGNQKILDGWGLPLKDAVWNFTMSTVSSLQVTYGLSDFSKDDKGEKENLYTFHQNSIYHGYYSYGDQKCSNLEEPRKVLGYPITKANLIDCIKSYSSGQLMLTEKPKKTVVFDEPSNTTLFQSYLPNKSLWKPTGVYLKAELHSVDYYSCNPNYKIDFVSNTDVGVSFLTVTPNSIGLWVTRLSDGSNLKDVSVSFYNINQKYSSTTSKTTTEVLLVGTKKTSAIGTVDFKTNNTNGMAVIEYDGDRLFIAKTDSLYRSYYYPVSTSAVIVTDRKLYNGGEKMYIKIYLSGEHNIYRFTIKIRWNVLDSINEFSQLVDIDDNYGTADLSVNIPDQVKMGPYSIILQGQNTVSDSSSDITFYESILISDPRIPSGVLSITPNQRYLQYSSSYTSLSASFSINTNTYLGVPLPNKNVSISCSFSRNSINSRSFSFTETKSIFTNNDGFASLEFTFDRKNVQFEDGDIITCSGSYMDSTGSLISQDSPMVISILSSEYSLQIRSESSVTRGYPSTVNVLLLNQTTFEPIKNIPIDVRIVESNTNPYDYQGKTIKNSIFNIWDSGKKKSLTTSCHYETDSSNTDKCYIVLPEEESPTATIYYLVVKASLPDGTELKNYKKISVDYEYKAGEDGVSAKGFLNENAKVFSIPDSLLWFTMDNEVYYPNQTVDVRFYNPFKMGTMTFKFGCGSKNQYEKQISKPHGFQTLSISIPSDCGGKTLSVVGTLIGTKYGFKISDSIPTSLTKYNPDKPNPQTFSLSYRINQQKDLEISIDLDDSIFKPNEQASFSIKVADPNTKKLIDEQVEACIMVVDKRNYDLYGNPIESGEKLSLDSPFREISDTRFNLIHNYREQVRIVEKILSNNKWTYFGWDRYSQISKNSSLFSFYQYEWFTERSQNSIFFKSFNTFAPSARQFDDEVADASPLMGTGANGAQSNQAIIKTNYQTTPLFIGKSLISNGLVNVSFTLPDDLTTFIIRVYIINKESQLYSKESSLISRKDLNMIGFSPRFVRTDDQFESGVSITRLSESIDVSDLCVAAKYKEPCIQFDSKDKVPTKDLVFNDNSRLSTNIMFSLTAEYQCDTATLYFFLQKKSSGEILDQITTKFAVLGKQAPLYVGTSFQVKANSTSEELLSLPKSEGDIGSLKITVGVGHLPVVEEKSMRLLSINKNRLPSSIDLLSQQVTYGALSSYSYNSSLIVMSQQIIESINEGFYAYTSSDYISWYPNSQPDFYPNLYATVLKGIMDVTNTAGWSIIGNISNWSSFVDQQLNSNLQDAVKNNRSIDKETIGLASIGFGYYWAPKDEDLNDLYSFNALTSNITDNCSLLCQTYFALAAIIREEYTSPFIGQVIDNLKNNIRIQGRTAYIESEGINNNPFYSLKLTTYASILFILRNESSPILPKMIEFISVGSSGSNGLSYFPIEPSSESQALSLIAISFYDRVNENTSPDLEFSAYQSNYPPIIQHHFYPNNNDSVEKVVPFNSLESNQTIQFNSKGTGEVSVAVGINYTPINIPTTPVYNGFYVEKIVSEYSYSTPSSSPATPINSSNEFYVGQEVMVTISVTVPDYMRDVYIEDGASGGIEPIDNNLDNSGDGPTPYYREPSLIWYYQPFSHRETRKEKVIFQGSNIIAGSYTVSYKCTVTSKGTFTMPPAKAYSSIQPEVFGTSNGFKYKVL
ncbi:hypothetical protein DICPUDRAFT_99830 [Dictyostelium purpureum]|uniref:Alpha-2-macroglobulin domain-containing protein n=1 Tax=Dictyostelium purpureum TaxID=5786 RepID=F1A2X2_DICPU|nr:uncharacterized protein DICPUDRAFT_99830 [Dictyostelium purpureum]EGC29461.1 hypothetical protein DICPUDRAFT_99830 [Dictyostelium purpureum]|eukprot:XP_003294015.1 hypothetical protein DICPUDRAFT_99830 [Dictyostelium purpureum]